MQKLGNRFELHSNWPPAGDQPKAIESLVDGLVNKKLEKQTLLGVTGSGKTFTIANVIQKIQKPTLVIAHNKTLAAQLAQEFKEFFPHNKVHYFVSYYDYYQPEAYVSATDTYIEKDATINEEIDKLRHASTQSILTRNDVIIVASVSCIYGLGSPKQYFETNLFLKVGDAHTKFSLMEKLVQIHFERTNADLSTGTFRAIGNRVDVRPASEEWMMSVFFAGGTISMIQILDPVSMKLLEEVNEIMIFPAKHFITDEKTRSTAIANIQKELDDRLKFFESQKGKEIEAERLRRRVTQDIAMIREFGYCSGIENYSRQLSGKKEGEAPDTLLEYFPRDAAGNPDFLTVIDESHVTLPQLRAMYAGDRARKQNLVDFGFRLPSALDNRPLRNEEFSERIGQVVYVSATPGEVELAESAQIVEQIIRPTGLIDPQIILRPVLPEKNSAYKGQIEDFIGETVDEVKKGGRVLVTTLTKKMAEDLSAFLRDRKIKAEYIHSDVKTMERIQILTKFRKGDFDCLVGVNLLREGLDLPEVSLIGILDADKEGFLRSETSLVQTIGRAARNVNGRVILYGDIITGSMDRAIKETDRRRAIQEAYNKEHDITPKTILKSINDITEGIESLQRKTAQAEAFRDLKLTGQKLDKLLKQKQKEMKDAARDLDFETAAILRDEIKELENMKSDKSDKTDAQKKKAKKTLAELEQDIENNKNKKIPNKIEKPKAALKDSVQKKGRWNNKK